MSVKKQESELIHLFQLRSVPVANHAARIEKMGEDKLKLAVPFKQPTWSKVVRSLLPMSKEKSIELDRLGAEIFVLCNGQLTVEAIIDIHKDSWNLTFFESRSMILQFLQQLVRHNFIALRTPAEIASSEDLSKMTGESP